MRIAQERSTARVSRSSTGTQAIQSQQARPPAELLALQRLVARKSSADGREPTPSASANAQIAEAARLGTSGTSGPLPYLATIQKSFGRHDVSGVAAYTDDAARTGSRAMRADGFTYGNRVAFAGNPTLHTAAHEAAHAVQQRGGVQLEGGVGKVGDQYERHADAVADAVVQGDSAEGLLDSYAGPAGDMSVQRELAELPQAEDEEVQRELAELPQVDDEEQPESAAA